MKDIQRLNGCIAALGIFVSKSAERCMLFFKALKLFEKTFQWDESCMKAWKDLKSYLANLPLLRVLTLDEVLYMYLSVSQQAVALHLPIYFVSRVLREYSYIEKLAYTLVISTQKLRAYFESHPVTIYTNHPLKPIFHKLDQPGRMLR